MEEVNVAGERRETKHNVSFLNEAVRRVSQDKQPATWVAQALGMSAALLARLLGAALRAETACSVSITRLGLKAENQHSRAQLASAE